MLDSISITDAIRVPPTSADISHALIVHPCTNIQSGPQRQQIGEHAHSFTDRRRTKMYTGSPINKKSIQIVSCLSFLLRYKDLVEIKIKDSN